MSNGGYHMYLSISEEDRISRFAVDAESGKLQPLGDTAVTGKPAPLALSPNGRFLYVGRRGTQQLSTFDVDQTTGDLSLIATVPLEADPNFLATDRRGRYLFSSYYQAGKAAVHAIGNDEGATAPPIEWLDTAVGAHSMQGDPSNRFVFVPHIADNGPNAIFQFTFDEGTGKLAPNSPPRFAPEEYLGPRHFCFHPSKDMLYCSNEQGGSVSAYVMDSSTGTLTLSQTVATLPAGYEGENLCSQIQISSDGRFLYVPNRGHSSIACFSIDQTAGHLTSIGQVPTEPVPRAFSLDPAGKFLFVAGLESGRLASYRIDGATGELEPWAIYTVGKAPMWVLVTELSP